MQTLLEPLRLILPSIQVNIVHTYVDICHTLIFYYNKIAMEYCFTILLHCNEILASKNLATFYIDLTLINFINSYCNNIAITIQFQFFLFFSCTTVLCCIHYWVHYFKKSNRYSYFLGNM